jgi:hypothetical protein
VRGGHAGTDGAPLGRFRRRGSSLALALLPFLLLFSSTRIYCENCRYEAIPGLSRSDAPRAASLAPAGSCCARARAAEGTGKEDGPPPAGSVRHKRSPICIGSHLPLTGHGATPPVPPARVLFARSDRSPLPSFHEADPNFPRSSRAPPA